MAGTKDNAEDVTPGGTTTVVLGTAPTSADAQRSVMFGDAQYYSIYPTWDEYEDWYNHAIKYDDDGNEVDDNVISKQEWKAQFGKNWRRARKALKNSNRAVFRNLTRDYTRKAYIKDKKLYVQGEPGYTAADYEAAEFKGDDPAKVVQAYNKRIQDWRDNATVVYKIGNDGNWGYYASGKYGNAELNDVNITRSKWWQDQKQRQGAAQGKAFVAAVDNAKANNDWKSQFAADYLPLVTLVSNYIPSYSDILGKISNADTWEGLDSTEKALIRTRISNAIQQYYNNMNKSNTWNDAVTADAWLLSLRDYLDTALNRPEWLEVPVIPTYIPYNTARNLQSSIYGSSIGDRLGFTTNKNGGTLKARALAKGGLVRKAGLGSLLGWDALDDMLDYIPLVGTANRIGEKLAGDENAQSWAEIGLGGLLDVITFVPGGQWAAGLKWTKNVAKTAKNLNKATKAAKKAEKVAEKAAKKAAATQSEAAKNAAEKAAEEFVKKNAAKRAAKREAEDAAKKYAQRMGKQPGWVSQKAPALWQLWRNTKPVGVMLGMQGVGDKFVVPLGAGLINGKKDVENPEQYYQFIDGGYQKVQDNNAPTDSEDGYYEGTQSEDNGFNDILKEYGMSRVFTPTITPISKFGGTLKYFE